MSWRILTFFTLVDEKDVVEAISDNLDAFEEDEDANVDDRDAISDDVLQMLMLLWVMWLGVDVDVLVKYGVEAFFDDVDAIVERF